MEKPIEVLYLKELKRGSHEAFSVLYDRYAGMLYGFALLHTKSPALSQDLVQDTFMKLWDMHASISLEGSFKSFLFTIAKNKMIDLFRSQINKVEFENYIAFCENESLVENTVEKHVYYDDFFEKLNLSKKLLTDRQLQIFEMNREQGLNTEVIARKLNISEQTVKNQLSSALKILRSKLKEYHFFYALLV